MDITRNLEVKRGFILEERARALAAKCKFYEAASLLEEIEHVDETTELGVKLLMAECYMQLGRENKASRAMKDIRKMVLTPPSPHIDDVIALADGFEGNSSFVRELFLLKLASEMYEESSSLSDTAKFDGIYKCISQSRNVTVRMVDDAKTSSSGSTEGLKELLEKLGGISDVSDLKKAQKAVGKLGAGTSGREVRLHAIAMDYGVENMLEMFELLRKMRGVEGDKKALRIANATNAIGYVYVRAKESEKGAKMRKIGIDTMEKHFGANAARYNMFGDLFHNLGVSQYNMDRCREAEASYVRAIQIYENAPDYDTEEKRQKDLKKSKSDLRDTRQRLA